MIDLSSNQLLVLAACALSLAVSLTAFVSVLRIPALSWKPFWALLALVGTGGAAIVWSAEAPAYWFFGVATPTVSYAAIDGGWEPALVRCLVPTGAIIVLVRLFIHARTARTAVSDPDRSPPH
ncbi:hypothetical protein [Qipengyuania sp. MTN3-11]|uniref:hypothetical protein n=1 Tax=Qipengyuania sp. MTN3-11 TaxID=3056557 RepID=UPI0036F364EB